MSCFSFFRLRFFVFQVMSGCMVRSWRENWWLLCLQSLRISKERGSCMSSYHAFYRNYFVKLQYDYYIISATAAAVGLIVGEQQLILFGVLLWFSVVLNSLFCSSPWIFCSELNYLCCSMMRLKQGGKELKTLLSDICITMSAGHQIRQYVHIPKCTLNIFVFCSCCNAINIIAYLVMLLVYYSIT